jgi:tripartite-type tricarboxylate transporter receptor subunit TctC
MKIISTVFMTLILTFQGGVHAQDDFPSKGITLVTPFAPGGGSDLVTRVLADGLQNALGQSVVVQNVSGAGGVVGSQFVARAKPDGYTLLLHHIGMATAPALFKDLQLSPLNSFEDIGLFADMPMIIVSGKEFPPKNMAELISYVKAKKTDVTFASSGAGSATHLCALMFESLVGEKVTMVQYRGAAPALIDVQSGRVDLLCDVTGGIVPHITSGSVKSFVITGSTRLKSIPELPTTDELELKGLDVSAWYGLYAPSGTPKPVVERLSQALQAVVKNLTVQERLAKMETFVFDAHSATPEAHRKKLTEQIKLWTDVIRKAGISAQ